MCVLCALEVRLSDLYLYDEGEKTLFGGDLFIDVRTHIAVFPAKHIDQMTHVDSELVGKKSLG